MLQAPTRVIGAAEPVTVHEILTRHALACPERVAIVEEQRSWTYGELHTAVQSAGGWLSAMGVRAGDRLMLVCENSCASVALYFAATTIGAWPVIVNARLSGREIEEIRAHSQARRVAFVLTGSAKAQAHAQALGASIHETEPCGRVALTPLNEATQPETQEQDSAEAVGAVIYTTGTTGRPKGVMLTHRNLLFVAQATARARRLRSTDRVYASLPISHTLGLSGVLLASLLSGAEIHLPSRFDPLRALRALADDQITAIVGTPAMYALMAEFARRKGLTPVRAPSLRLISSAGAPLDAATKTEAEKVLGQTLHNGYGISECGPSIAITALDTPRADCSIGRLLPGVEAKLVGGDDESNGELWVRTPGLMKGYYKAPEETRQVIDGEGWFRTGDLAQRDEDGHFFIVGRAKELIVCFGFNVYPAEIEAVLNSHPAVLRSAVIGRTGAGTEEIVAYVQPADGDKIKTAELAAYTASHLASYKQPSAIIVLREMPLAPNGKILKAALSELQG